MQGRIENKSLIISCTGVAYLKLKAALSKNIGDKFSSTKESITIPLQYIPRIHQVLPPEIVAMPLVNAAILDYSKHAAGVEVSKVILTQTGFDSSSIPLFWQNILEPAQSVAVAAMTVPDLLGLCLFDEQGSGKTVMTIAAFDILKSQRIIDAMIVVCPKSMVNEWPKDINRFLPGKYKVEVPSGDRQAKYKSALKAFDIIVTNFETIALMQSAISGAAQTLNFLLVVDESFYVKNASALRSHITAEIRSNCKKCYLLCGSPAPNSPYDIINQFDLADLGYTFNNFSKSKDEKKDREIITKLVDTRGAFIRRLKTDILASVPTKNFHIIKANLKGRQLLLYEKARFELLLELKGLDNTTFKKHLASYFQKRAALLQICTTPSSIDPTIIDTPVKYEKIDNLLNDLISAKRKVIIWSFFKSSIEELFARYSKYDPLRIDGTTDSNHRSEYVNLFQNDPNRMLFIGNPAAAGAGITLHSSYDAIYVSFSNQAAHYLQSLDRIHRRGQKAAAVNYYIIICENTIEEKEIIRLRKKELQQHSLLGDHITWPTTLDDALNELDSHGK